MIYHYMKRSHMWGIIAGIVFAVNLGILIYWGSQVEDLATWDYEYKFYPLYGFFAALIPLGIAGYYSHKEGDRFDWNKAFDG